MREDGRQQVCIVGLKEFRVSDVELVKEYIDKGNQSRSTGSTGANEESSRSHAILQLVVKKTQEGKEVSRVVGKISFIDLAGSERGADTTDNDRQTRLVLGAPLVVHAFVLLQILSFKVSCEIHGLNPCDRRNFSFCL
jgi:kinesin family protein 2/24